MEYGIVNNFTTETYESLHKEWVKNPYRMSNKWDATSQILHIVSKNTLNNYQLVLALCTTLLTDIANIMFRYKDSI